MLEWSIYFQNPDFLEYTRLEYFMPEYEPLIRKWCGVQEGKKVLDIGCGTGFFSRLLKKGAEALSVTGLDIDEIFLSRAKEEAERENLDIKFLKGDALNLPFENSSFDIITSQTFFTSIPDPEKALSEMKRVLRPGGRIASLTAMRFKPVLYHTGFYTFGCSLLWANEFNELDKKFFNVCNTILPISNFTLGLNPAIIPNFFASHGLKNVCAYPIGKIFSLSNAAISDEVKLRWLELYESSMTKKLEAFMKLSEFREAFTDDEAKRYLELLRMKCEYYKANLHDNETWEINGAANILITGDLINS